MGGKGRREEGRKKVNRNRGGKGEGKKLKVEKLRSYPDSVCIEESEHRRGRRRKEER